jgi:hypothetical protein
MITLVYLEQIVAAFAERSKIPHDTFIYKKCQEYIIVMRKLDDTITNESRLSVRSSTYAKHRANKLEVLLIIDMYYGTTTEKSIVNRFNYYSRSKLSGQISKCTNYVVGSIVEPDTFDNDLENVCSNGIHYFKSLERAYYYGINLCLHNGPYKNWRDNGELCEKSNYEYGRLHGRREIWDSSSNDRSRSQNYVYGELIYEYKYSNGHYGYGYGNSYGHSTSYKL